MMGITMSTIQLNSIGWLYEVWDDYVIRLYEAHAVSPHTVSVYSVDDTDATSDYDYDPMRESIDQLNISMWTHFATYPPQGHATIKRRAEYDPTRESHRQRFVDSMVRTTCAVYNYDAPIYNNFQYPTVVPVGAIWLMYRNSSSKYCSI